MPDDRKDSDSGLGTLAILSKVLSHHCHLPTVPLQER